MKRTLILLALAIGAIAIAASLPPSLTISANVSGTPTKDEKRMMIWLIGQANATITATNGTALPSSTNLERKASYETVLGWKLAELHQNNLNASASAAAAATVISGDDMDKITACIIDLLQAGGSITNVLERLK